MPDRRKRSRVETHFAGVVFCESRDFSIATENISLKGALCEVVDDTAEGLDGESCIMRITLSADAVIEVRGSLVRAGRNRVAIDFEEMDPDSYAHLRNIVRLLADDADLIDEEQTARGFDGDEDDDAFERQN
ncbi:hypothetical protein JCM16814_07520 [Desulfobaculum senezii]|jgi:hypothetical protein